MGSLADPSSEEDARPDRDNGSDFMATRIVRIIDRLNVGGPAKHVVWLTSGLQTARFQTELITGACALGETDMGYFARGLGVQPRLIPSMSREIGVRDCLVIIRLIQELFRLKPDVVHTHKSKAGTTGRIAAMVYKWLSPSALRLQPRRCKVVHTYHGHIFHSYYGPTKSWLFLSIERLLARVCTDRIIVISELQRREICERFRVGHPRQFRLIPLGIDMEELPQAGGPVFREELQVPADELLIGAVGRLTAIKNHIMLLQSAKELFRLLAGVGLRARFVIIGDGHLRPRLEQHAQELGIAKQVTFTGFRPEVLSLYPALDVIAFTSLNEGTPLTLIEAMACGLATAATEVGGVPDLLGTRRFRQEGFSVWDHGVTVPSQDVASFARALKFLAERPTLRAQMGAQGCAFARMNFSRERLLQDFAQLYGELSVDVGSPLQTRVQPVVDSNL